MTEVYIYIYIYTETYIYIYIYIYNCSIFTDNCCLLLLLKKTTVYKWIKVANAVQHEYHFLRDSDYTPVTRRGKITSNHRQLRI